MCCSNVENVVLGSGITSIGYYDYSNCKNLKGITLRGNVTSIAYDAFMRTKMDEFTIPSTVTIIEDQAFQYSAIKKLNTTLWFIKPNVVFFPY